MSDRFSAPWHKTSFERFIHDRLPQLLADRVPLAGYRAHMPAGPVGPLACRIQVEISAGGHTVAVEYGPIPAPDESGTLWIGGQPYVVVPTASQEELDQAEMRCIGEQLYDAIQARLGQAPADMAWDESIARAFLPLDSWIHDFLRTTAQHLDTTNWHAIQTHLRRIIVLNRKRVIAPGQMGRVDPFETPEGPNIGRVFTIAVGAEIQGERLVIVDDRPEAALGPNAQMVPFLEHDDANRLLMGVNMMRQGLVPAQPEPALVQTGNEPEGAGPDLWCGRNLLTAFVAWSEGCVEDGLILSESAVKRLDYPYPAEYGDKLANRHGTKGVVSQILPDEQMPHLPDGRPVEILFSFSGLVNRLNFGQEREAVMGLIAKAEGKPAIVPPFHAPPAEAIRSRLVQNGLPGSGMLRLRRGKDGPELEMESLVGYVYWYRLAHLARPKLYAVGVEPSQAAATTGAEELFSVFQPMAASETIGNLEIKALIQAGALENAREMMTVRAQAGPAEHSAYFDRLAARLAPAGIALRLENNQLAPHTQLPAEGIALARPFRHPWLNEITIERVGPPPEGSETAAQKAYQSLVEANQRLERYLEANPMERTMASRQIPSFGNDSGLLTAPMQIEKALEGRLTPQEWEVLRLFMEGNTLMQLGARFSASESTIVKYLQAIYTKLSSAAGIDPTLRAGILRAINFAQGAVMQADTALSPYIYLNTLMLKVERQLAAYFDALLPQEALQVSEAQKFSGRAVIAPGAGLRLDQVGLPAEIARALFGEEDLAGAWVVVLRAPALAPTALIAFHPVVVDGPAIRLHPQASILMNADFDGDQVAVFRPLSAEAQREAGEKLSVAAHVRSNPTLAAELMHPHEAVWGLAWLSLEEKGRAQIADLLGAPSAQIPAPLPQTTLVALAQALIEREGVETALPRLERLARMGYQAASNGASLSPFPDENLVLPPQPESNDPAEWEPYLETVRELVLSRRDYTNPVLGPQLLSAYVRPRSRWVLPLFLGPRLGQTIDEQAAPIRHGNVQGFTPDELSAWVAGARRGLAQLAIKAEQALQPSTFGMDATPISLLARARASRRPGIAFARAAASGEVDPLTDGESRVLLGLS